MDMKYDHGYRTSKVGERGQVTIPQELRRRYGIRPGAEMLFEEHPEGLILRRQVADEPLRALIGRIRERIDVDKYLEETRGPAPADGPDE